ncbi:unnamed protein product [Scytosiphon promiscuus]
MSKRPRSIDHHQENAQQQPPHTRRMLDGMGCAGFVGSSSGGLIRSMPLLVAPPVPGTDASIRNESRPAVVALGAACGLSSPSRIIEREGDSMSSSVSSVRSSDSSCATGTKRDEKEIDLSGFASVPTSNLKSADLESSVGSGSSPSSSGWDSDWVCRREGEDVDENELGLRMGYLQMRGFDKSLMDMMDESVYGDDSECSEEYRLLCQGYSVDDEPQQGLGGQHDDDSEIKAPVYSTANGAAGGGSTAPADACLTGLVSCTIQGVEQKSVGCWCRIVCFAPSACVSAASSRRCCRAQIRCSVSRWKSSRRSPSLDRRPRLIARARCKRGGNSRPEKLCDGGIA